MVFHNFISKVNILEVQTNCVQFLKYIHVHQAICSCLKTSVEKDKALISFTSSHQIYFSNYFITSGTAEYYQPPLGDCTQRGNKVKVLTSHHAAL